MRYDVRMMKKEQRPYWRRRPIPSHRPEPSPPKPSMSSGMIGTYIFAAFFFAMALYNFIVYMFAPAGVP